MSRAKNSKEEKKKNSGGFLDGLIELGKDFNDYVEKEEQERQQVDRAKTAKIASLEGQNADLRNKLLAERERVFLLK